jgi:hypothetical protein
MIILIMDTIMKLTQLITVRQLTPEEHQTMMTCTIKLTELIKIAEEAILKKQREDEAPPWGR